jgi:hypothetical protein
MHELEGTSHSLRVESRDVERMFLPRAMMPVEDIMRVCPRRVRTGVIRVLGVMVSDGGRVDMSAGRMLREKSPPAERSTREEGKNWREVTVLRCGLEVTRCERGGVMEFGICVWGSGKEVLGGRGETG